MAVVAGFEALVLTSVSRPSMMSMMKKQTAHN
jgi:hypothetical protein